MHWKATLLLALAVVGSASSLAMPPKDQSADRREVRSRDGAFSIVRSQTHGRQSIAVGTNVNIDAPLLSRLLAPHGRTR